MKSSTAARPWEWEHAQDITLREMWRADATIAEIAAAIGCTRCQADRRRNALQLPSRPIGWKPASAPKLAPYYQPSPPRCVSGDAAFARAMAGRKFSSLKMSPDPRRLHTASREAGLWASSIELNA